MRAYFLAQGGMQDEVAQVMWLGRGLSTKLGEAGFIPLQAVGSHRCRLSPLTVAELALVAWAALCACSGPLRCCAAEQIAQVVQVGRAQGACS